MFWDAHKDLLFISVGKITNQASTKQKLVSDIAWTFDVLGWLSPSAILMKILFQQLWQLKLDWDDEVPQALQDKHQLWREQRPLFKDFPFKHCYHRPEEPIQHSELHGFSEASEDTYAAVVYLRTLYTTGSPTMSLVASKTKVAPLKRQSIPRLELCGVHLLTKLITQVRNALTIDLNHTFSWTDSTIILYWLDGSPKRFKTFGAIVYLPFWTCYQQEFGNMFQQPPILLTAHLMDSFHKNSSNTLPGRKDHLGCRWSHLNCLLSLSSPSLGTSELKAVCHAVTPTSPDWIEDRYSSFTTLCRITAWSLRFVSNIRACKKQNVPILTHLFLLLNSKQQKSIFTFSLKTDTVQTNVVVFQPENPSRTLAI